MEFVYRKVTSSRLVYYSFFEHFLEATNSDAVSIVWTHRHHLTVANRN